MSTRHYDYIIAGAGLSGLSLAHYIIHSPLSNKKLLIVDKSLQQGNEKTWSFWHKGPPPFEACIHKSWRQVQVVFGSDTIAEQLQHYTYHSIQSGVFREAMLDELRRHPSADLLEAAINALHGGNEATLVTDGDTFTADYIFQSCLPAPALKQDRPCYPLIQHFLGWEITSVKPVFDASKVTLMDFDGSFKDGLAFIYILPWTPKKALVEYTIFSNSLKQKDFYREKLDLYLYNKFNLRSLDYKRNRTEFGQIPMQDHPYAPWYAPRVLNMGTVGGLTKPSTGYTFSRVQQHARAVVTALLENKKPALPLRSPFRYRAYDLWLLQIIHDHPAKALDIFKQLFSNNTMDEIFRFLSEENTLSQDLKTMSKVSYFPFMKAIWETKKRLFEL